MIQISVPPLQDSSGAREVVVASPSGFMCEDLVAAGAAVATASRAAAVVVGENAELREAVVTQLLVSGGRSAP
jgi:hypothetical protein